MYKFVIFKFSQHTKWIEVVNRLFVQLSSRNHVFLFHINFKIIKSFCHLVSLEFYFGCTCVSDNHANVFFLFFSGWNLQWLYKEWAVCTWRCLYKEWAICTWRCMYKEWAVCTWRCLYTEWVVCTWRCLYKEWAICTWICLYKEWAVCTWRCLALIIFHSLQYIRSNLFLPFLYEHCAIEIIHVLNLVQVSI